jgi:EmrB/QacA subfamily drug resistance transporter
MGIAIGPITGGWLIEHFDWSAIFLVNLPAVVACLFGGALLVPESRNPASPPVDIGGAGLSIAGLTAVVWALIEAPDRGWTDGLILGAFAAGAGILAVFAIWERRVEHPMLNVRVFRNARFSAASLSVAFVFFALMGVLYFLTTYLQTVLDHSALQAGIRMLPIAIGMLLTAKPAVVLTERLGTKVVVACGLAIAAGSLVMIARFGLSTGDGQIALTLMLMGAGIGLTMSPATEAIMGALPKEKAGVGSAMNDVVREVAGSLGVAVLGSILTSAYASSMGGATSGLTATAATQATDSVGAAHQVAATIGGTAGTDLIATSNHAFVDAMATTASIAAAIAIVGALIAAAFLPARARREAATPHAEPAQANA